jgi:hypothetical protein
MDKYGNSFSKLNMKKHIIGNNNYDFFGNDTFEELHFGKIFLHMFGEFFSKYRIRREVNAEGLSNALIEKYSLTRKQIIKSDRASMNNLFVTDFGCSEELYILKHGLVVAITSNLVEIIYIPDIQQDEINEIIILAKGFIAPETKTSKFFMIQNSSDSLNLAEFDIRTFNIDLNTHYNDDFIPINDIISKSLKERTKNGLILLHGKYGSGKTYYLRHLINTIERRFIYFPLNLIEELNSPNFLPFISDYPNSILILEDCESLLIHRENGLNNGSALSNLLNLGDGLLSDALSVNVICTFNAGIKKIDDAILRKGRLIARYEFKELETSKAQNLATNIGKNCSIDHPMTVSDIYNLSETSFENKPARTVGFKVS